MLYCYSTFVYYQFPPRQSDIWPQRHLSKSAGFPFNWQFACFAALILLPENGKLCYFPPFSAKCSWKKISKHFLNFSTKLERGYFLCPWPRPQSPLNHEPRPLTFFKKISHFKARRGFFINIPTCAINLPYKPWEPNQTHLIVLYKACEPHLNVNPGAVLTQSSMSVFLQHVKKVQEFFTLSSR